MKTCPKCKGSGVVFNRISVLFTVCLPLVWGLEKLMLDDEDEGLTRARCPKCDGEGEVE